MHARWEYAGAGASPAVPHVLVVAATTVLLVLAIVAVWMIVASAVQDAIPRTQQFGPIPGPGLDL